MLFLPSCSLPPVHSNVVLTKDLTYPRDVHCGFHVGGTWEKTDQTYFSRKILAMCAF